MAGGRDEPGPVRSLRIEPPASEWAGLIRARFGRAGGDARRFRSQLGLPTDRPIVMSGHQPGFWHPGIVAKLDALHAGAAAAGAAPAWVIVDQDVHDMGLVALPSRPADGALRRTDVRLVPPASGRPWGLASPAVPLPARWPDPPEELDPGALEQARGLLDTHRDAPTAADQATRAALDAAGAARRAETTLVTATSIACTDLFGAWLDRMRTDPAGLHDAYNAGVKRTDAGVPPLRTTADGGAELPVWILDAERGERRRGFDAGVRGAARLAPRALLMTALLRSAACDLFIHGLGGGRYDAGAEAWIRAWLGESLAPIAVVSADVVLPFDAATSPEAALRSRVHRAHTARHNPALLGAAAYASQKAVLLEEIERERTEGGSPERPFRALHALLARYRKAHAAPLDVLARDGRRAAAALREREVAAMRDWPAFVHPSSSLRGLRTAIDRAFDSPAE